LYRFHCSGSLLVGRGSDEQIPVGRMSMFDWKYFVRSTYYQSHCNNHKQNPAGIFITAKNGPFFISLSFYTLNMNKIENNK